MSKSLKVVIVDDQSFILEILKQLLDQINIKPVAFTSALKAYEYMKSHSVNLLISDYFMPDLNGVELIQEIKKLKPLLKTVMITSLIDENQYLIDACKALDTVLIYKPLDSIAFQSCISKFMDKETHSLSCIKDKNRECIGRDKVATSTCMVCCRDDIEDEKNIVINTIDALDDFYASEFMMEVVSAKLSYVSSILNACSNKSLQELLLILKRFSIILYEQRTKILEDVNILSLVESYLLVIRQWLDSTYISNDLSQRANNLCDSITADFYTIEMALGLCELPEVENDDLDDLFF